MSRLQALAERSGLSLSEALDAMLTGQEAEARYQALVASAGRMVWTLDPDGHVTLPDGWTALTGQPLAEAAGQGWHAHIHPGDRDALARLRQTALAAPAPFSFECRVLRHDGAFRRVHSKAAPIFAPDGALREWVGASEDVEDALGAVEVCQRVAAVAPCLIAMATADGTLQRVNAAAEALLGRSAEALAGMALGALWHPDDRDLAQDALASLVEAEEATILARVCRPGLPDLPVDWRMTLSGGRLYVAGADATARLAAARAGAAGQADWTQEREALLHKVSRLEAQLAASGEAGALPGPTLSDPLDSPLRTYFERAIAYLAVLDPEGRYADVNEAALKRSRLTASELKGLHLWESPALLDEANREVVRTLVAAAAQGTQASAWVSYRDAEGQPMVSDLAIKPVTDADGRIVHLIAEGRDVTKTHHRMEALRAELDAARRGARTDRENSTHALLRQAEAIAGLGSFEVQIGASEMRWSEGHYRLYGRPALHKALSFDVVRAWLHPDDLPAIREAFETGFSLGAPIEVEYRVLRPDGTQRRLRSTCQPVPGEPDRFVGVTQDMTSRIDAVRALARSERQYRELFAHVAVGLFISDTTGRFLSVNPAAAAMLGYRVEELETMAFADVVHPEDLAVAVADFKGLDAWGAEVRREKRYVRKDGSVLVGDVTVRALAAEGDAPGYTFAMLRDITEQRRAEAESRQAELRFRALFEAAPIGISLGDERGHVLEANDAFAALLGYTRRELQSMVFTQYTHPDDVGHDWAVFKQLVAGEIAHYALDKRYLAKDGRVVTAQVAMSRAEGANGAPSFVVAMAQDVTEKRRAEAALANSQQLLAETQAIARMGAWAWYPDEDRLTWSDAASRLIGVPEGQAPTTVEAFLVRVHPDDREAVRRRLAAVIQDGQPAALDFRTVGPEPRVIFSQARVDRDASGSVKRVIGIDQDVTARRAAEAQTAEALAGLEAANARMRESERYKDEFLAVVNHELRTPLNFIMGFASVLEDGLAGPLSGPQRRHLGRIQEGADRLNAMVDDMLLVAQVDAGTLALDRQPVGYASLCREAAADMAAEAEHRGVTIICEATAPERAVIDALRIKRVIAALLENAVKFSPSGGRVWLRARFDGEQCVTEVADEGPGIPPADQPRVFERFHQLDMSVTRAQGGAGLGLALAKGFIEAHGGVIGVDSAPGRGSTFWFTLPQSERSSR